MQMPGRKYTQPNSTYRYGFNGKENDNDVKGEGNQQDYGMRIYDPRLGRFLSVDPLTKSFSMLTPYQFATNRPIDGIDLDGQEYFWFNEALCKFSSIQLRTSTNFTLMNNIAVSNTTVTGIAGAQGELNVVNCSGWLKNYVRAYNNNTANWPQDANGNKSIGTTVTWLGAFRIPIVADKIASTQAEDQNNAEKFAKSPLSTFGRGSTPNVPTANQQGSAGSTMTGGGKLGGALQGLVMLAETYSKIKTYKMNSEVSDADKQFGEYGWRVLARIQYAIDNKLIPGHYLNEKSITQIANYFLNGSGVETGKLKEFSQKLWTQTDNLYYEEKGKKVEFQSSGNSGNTGVAPKSRTVQTKVLKKI